VANQESTFKFSFDLEQREDRWVARAHGFSTFVYGSTKAEALARLFTALEMLVNTLDRHEGRLDKKLQELKEDAEQN